MQDGKTSLELAVEGGHTEIMEMLLAAGDNIEAADEEVSYAMCVIYV